MTDPILLVGGGGHCKSCVDVIESAGQLIAGIIEKELRDENIFNYKVIGTDDDLEELAKQQYQFVITVGQIKSAALRIKLFERIKKAGGRFANVIAPSAVVSKHSFIGDGTIVMHQALINAASSVGENCIINNKALIEHDAVVGDHTHVSTAAIVNGGCNVGKGVFIGSNSVIVQGVEITDNVIIGSGSVVIKNIIEPGLYVGNPANKINK